MKLKFLSVLAGSMVVLGACNNSKKDVDKCDSIPCPFECKDGNCVCPPGYSGRLCEDIWFKNYIGIWTHYVDGSLWSDRQVIKNSTTDFSVLLLDNFWDTNNVPAKMTSKTTFKFYENERLEDGYTLVSGEGTLNDLGTKITGSYTIMNGAGSTVTFQFEWSKR